MGAAVPGSASGGAAGAGGAAIAAAGASDMAAGGAARRPVAARALSWCAGEERPKGASLHDYMAKALWAADEEDVCRNAAHDITAARYFQSRLRRARDGRYGFFLAGPPCRTFSISRFQPGYARPLRRRSCRGRVPGLSVAETWALDEADLIVERTCRVAREVWAAGGDFVIENPIDRGGDEVPEGTFREPDHFPLWLMPEVQRLQHDTGATLIQFPQCTLGLEWQKWTALLCSPGAAARLQYLSELRCTHTHSQAAGGYDAQGQPVGPRAARYPDLMLQALAAAGARALPAESFASVGAEGGDVAESSAQLLRAGLAGWAEAPAFRRGLGAAAADVGRFSLAALLPERPAVARRLAFESAEHDVVQLPARTPWRVRAQARAERPLGPVERLAEAPVCVGHAHRWRRPGFSPVWVGRGRGSSLGNPFTLSHDGRSPEARARTPLREAVCGAYRELLCAPVGARAATRVAEIFGGLQVEAAGDTSAAAQARHAALDELVVRARGGERLELLCTCHPLMCHAEALRDVILERVGFGVAPVRGPGACVDAAWRPEGGAAGLFLDAADWDAMRGWRRQAAAAWAQMEAGGEVLPPSDLHIPASRLRPEARALAPWRTGGAFAAAPVPVAAQAQVPACGLHADVFQRWAAANDGDAAIASELPWGLEDEAEGADIYLAFHHASCWADPRYAGAVSDTVAAEGPGGEGWLQEDGEIPYVPLRCVPKGVVDQIHKLRVVTDHTHPFGAGISANDGVDLDTLPDLKFSSGVKFARIVGILASADVGVLMWKRDAVSAYRQVPIHPMDLWKCGMVGPGGLLIDVRLSFGARMAPNKFQRLMLVAVQEATRRIAEFDAAHPPVDERVLRWLRGREHLDAAAGACRLSGVIQYIDDTLGCSINDFIPAISGWRGLEHARIFDEVMAEAGVAMATGAKCLNSESEVEALGIMVSVEEGAVYYPTKKRERLEALIDSVLELAAAPPGSVPLAAVESLIGKEKWVAHVAPALGPHLASAYALAAGRSGAQRSADRRRADAPLTASAAFVADQREIRRTLASQPRRPLIPRSEFPPLDHPSSTVVAQDASGSWGIGGYVLCGSTALYFAEPYPAAISAALRARDISICSTELAAELAAVMIAIQSGASATYLTDFTDNEAARVAASRGTSTAPAMAPLAHELASVIIAASRSLRTLRITTKENAIADALSRDGDDGPLLAAVAAARGRAVRVDVPARVWELLHAML